MVKSMLGTWALAAGVVSAMSGKICHNMTMQIPVTSRNGVFGNISTPMTNLEATMFAQAASRQGFNGTELALTGYATISKTYPIAATYCMPGDENGMTAERGAPCDTEGSNSTTGIGNGGNHTLQVLTHGIGFDRSYWDIPYSNYNYSYVDAALSHGYHALFYDRLGIGMSAHGEPKNEIQSFLEIAALAQMTRMIRSGSLPGMPSKPAKIVHGGHSFGSTQTYAMTSMYPDISDGIILTGFSSNSTFLPYFEAGANFKQFKLDKDCETNLQPIHAQNYELGYLASSDIGANQYLFFYPPHFDMGILCFAEVTKQPVTPGELLTVGSIPTMSKFAGPVLVVTGDHDLPFCGGDCYNTGGTASSIPAASKKAFPAARTFDVYLVPECGHGINLHYNAIDAYNKISDWLASSGLTS